MSYVLEALRRAEAERQRGQVPGLHAQTLSAPELAAAGPGGPSRRRPTAWASAVIGLVALAATGFWWLSGGDAPTASPDLPVAPTASARAEAPAAPLVVVVPQPVRPPAARAPATLPATSPTPADAGQPAAGASIDEGPPVVSLAQMPESLRRQMPPLAFGGATHSPEPSARMLIINGQVWREGDELAPGLRLERIDLRAAQFRFRDRRFEIVY